ncbi:MAG: hypothetical protein V4482_00500 [Pseudomonadota bacterium]
MKNKFILLLIIASLGPVSDLMAASTSSSSARAETIVDPVLLELINKTNGFANADYTETSDDTAREITRKLLNPSATKFATPAEREEIVNVHLKTELYYAFNTQWGTGKQRNHRIVYDFLSQLDKSGRASEHLTIITVLSLAAQEYFWNNKSTIEDLKRHVKRELRYGLFKQAGHKLNVSNIIYLDETRQNSVLDRVIETWITGDLRGKLAGLMNGFKARSLGNIYIQIAEDLDAKFRAPLTPLPFDNLEGEILSAYGLRELMNLKPMASAPDGMCGEHSLLIPTDGKESEYQSVVVQGNRTLKKKGILEGNGRYKILRAILDNAYDEEARRLYLYASKYMDGTAFTNLMEEVITRLRGQNSEAQANELHTKLIAYKKSQEVKEIEKETKRTTLKISLLRSVVSAPELKNALNTFNELLNNPDYLSILPTIDGFKDIIDAIKLIGTNTEPGAGNDSLKRRFSTIEVRLNLLDQRIKQAKLAADMQLKLAITEAEGEAALAKKEFDEIRTKNDALVETYLELNTLKAEAEAKAKKEKNVAFDAAFSGASTAYSTFMTPKNEQLFAAISAKFTAKRDKNKIAKAAKELEANYTERDALIAGKYKLMIEKLKDFIGPDMLPGNTDAFSIDGLCIHGYSNFINDICQTICTFISHITDTDYKETADEIAALWDDFNSKKGQMEVHVDQQLKLKRLEIVTSLHDLPAELAPNALANEMEQFARCPGELSGWLPCDSSYTQLWAIINNLNVFVFSNGEAYGPTPLDLIIRNKNSYDQVLVNYPEGTSEKHLATVILTSPTAKNVFLDKGPGHYDKFIEPDDYAAMAKAQRHLEWMELATKYAAYP